MNAVLAQVADNVTVNIGDNATLPGRSLIVNGINWLGYIAVVASVASLLIGGALWGLGQLGGNPQSAQRGRQLVIGGLIGALIAGAAVLLVDQLYTAGGNA